MPGLVESELLGLTLSLDNLHALFGWHIIFGGVRGA